MVSDKALYTVAVVVLALGLSSSITNRPDWIQRLDERSQSLAMQVLDRAQRYVAMSDQFLGRSDARFERTEAAIIGAQTRLAAAQTAIVRSQVRMVTTEKMNQAVIRCSTNETEEADATDTPNDPED